MIGWAIETLIATTLLMVLVMAIRQPVRRNFGSGVAYALWLLPAGRLFMPQLPGDSQLTRLVEPIAQQVGQGPGYTVGLLNPATLPPAVAQHATTASAAIGRHGFEVAVVPPTAVEHGTTIGMLLLGLWAVGATAFLLYYVAAHLRFRHSVLRGAGPDRGKVGGVHVIESDAAHGPLAFGVWRKYVAFPRDFADRYDADEREFALLHELGHHHRGDLIANWVALALLAVHWFNPIAWRAYRAFRADQEMANDARVLAGRSAVERHAYACAIVKAAHPAFGSVSATCHLNTIKDLKGRLKMLTTGRHSRARLATGGIAVAALTLAGLGLTASGSAAAGTVRAGVEKATGLDFAKLDARLQSAPPAPPAPPSDVEVSDTPDTPAAPGKRYKIVRVGKDGRTTSTEWVVRPAVPMPPMTPMTPMTPMAAMTPVPPATPAVPYMPNIPEVRSANCPGSGPAADRQMVLNRTKGDKQIILICQNRIERAAQRGAEMAANSKDIERNAYTQALAGLRAARARMANDPKMTGEARSDALEGIDESIKELEDDLAHAD
ncbi:MAG: peptidase M56 [Sphingomonas sp.]|uniref:M56 family metallopeptidase n=1 Tax=Sphingomonas sp. TaxID=28214 RepID=UPI001AD1522C|nr:M56 family metallopeptidase [Sphingomonas sp.]MBN8807074.1 peptidase M56 [Sphingomonas sp.]